MSQSPLRIGRMFDPRDHSNVGRIGSDRWNCEVFTRAYCDPDQPIGQFDKVVTRLRSGFSVLVYLPGNCMTAAADAIARMMEDKNWNSCGKHPGGKSSPMNAWDTANSIVGSLLEWLSAPEGQEPHVIFHNLDLLRDAHGGVLATEAAQSAVFSLIEATRRGVVLGLADRDSGELPAPIQHAFSDQVWFRTIDESAFRRIIPEQLGELIARDDDTIPEGPVQQITTRLQWSDPIRAVRIMDSVAGMNNVGQLDEILDEIRRRTCPPEYVDAATVFPEDSPLLTGFDSERTLARLESQIVRPYRDWVRLNSSRIDELQARTEKLRKGVILHGPPGTGKTTLAKWLARRVQLPIRIVSAAEIRRPLYGDAERMVRQTFTEARRAAPCVLSLDDADDLFPHRSRIGGSVASADLGIVNAALQELDGINGPMTGVLVVMTTNRFDSLDEPIRQRLEFHVRVSYPIDHEQIGEIVDSAADKYRFFLTPEIRNELISEFYGPVDVHNVQGLNQPSATRDERRRCTAGLFAPRMIQRDMLVLQANDEVNSEGVYEVSQDDVDRLRQYHEESYDENQQPA